MQRRVAIHVRIVHVCSMINEKFDSMMIAVSGGSNQWCFTVLIHIIDVCSVPNVSFDLELNTFRNIN